MEHLFCDKITVESSCVISNTNISKRFSFNSEITYSIFDQQGDKLLSFGQSHFIVENPHLATRTVWG